ncbi:HNH endonuclease (plasmid) [Acaryochloris sp. 'Moss Beach']|uniref:HNH endonuclease n=1 Tax=Acaryochloris sp. 'Moss Beach' TaxID=2740837 RepID=UPI001F2C30E6|nr:HNH endonuclease [Acaryochloris sp. 'Moss Beach']UJB72329.1 HNH endonuclease [Acaryochloris sp. 'Moss Beach']
MNDNQETTLEELFTLADKAGKRRYHKLTNDDFKDYRKYDNWRYINGDGECGTTEESKIWVNENSEWNCPVCCKQFSSRGGRSIDHKLPRAQYPWVSLDFKNFWVICLYCNREKGERHWYEYEHYILINHPEFYDDVAFARPRQLLKKSTESK